MGQRAPRRPRRRRDQDRGSAQSRRRGPLRAALPGGRGLALLRDVLPQQAQRLARSHAPGGPRDLRGHRAQRRRRLQQPARRRAREAAHPLRRPRRRQPGDRVLCAHGLRHDGPACRGGRLRLHPAGLRGLDVSDRRARRASRQDGALARRHVHRLRRGARADVRALGRAARRRRLRLRHLPVRDRDEPQHVRLDLAPLARLRAGALRELRSPLDRAVPELPDARRLDRDRLPQGQVLRAAVHRAGPRSG